MLDVNKPLIVGLSYTGKEIKEWVKANPDNEISKKLKELPQFKENRIHSLPDHIYFKVVSKVHEPHLNTDVERRTIEILLERDFVMSPRIFKRRGV